MGKKHGTAGGMSSRWWGTGGAVVPEGLGSHVQVGGREESEMARDGRYWLGNVPTSGVKASPAGASRWSVGRASPSSD